MTNLQHINAVNFDTDKMIQETENTKTISHTYRDPSPKLHKIKSSHYAEFRKHWC